VSEPLAISFEEFQGIRLYITYVIRAFMSGTYRAPEVPSERITGEFVRDELLRCFESANREFLTLLKQPVADEALKTQVNQFVRGVFQNCGVSYVHPTKTGILTAIAESTRSRHHPSSLCRDDEARRPVTSRRRPRVPRHDPIIG